MTVIEQFGIALTEWLEIVVNITVSAFEGVIPIFWNTTTGFTIYGLLMIFGLAVGFVGLAIGFMYRLLQK